MDKLVLKSCKFYGYHGMTERERQFGQSFTVDIHLYFNSRDAGKTDNLIDTVDYGKIYDISKEYVENQSYNLIEYLAEKIAQHILNEFAIIYGLKIVIKKQHTAIISKYDYVAIEIERFRNKENKKKLNKINQ